jgi:prevent-host-death family protein
MKVSNIHEAKTHLSDLIQRAYEGEEIIICKAGKPMVKLVKFDQINQARLPGYWKSQIKIAEDFDDLPESFMKAFRGSYNYY